MNGRLWMGLCGGIGLLLGVGGAGVRADSAPAAPAAVRLEFFYETGCEDCERVRARVLPELARHYGGRIRIEDRELGVLTNYIRLVALQEAAPTAVNATVFLAVEGGRLLQGVAEIERAAKAAIDERLAAPAAAKPPDFPAPESADSDRLMRRFAQFRWVGVAIAGVADGLNPCAFSTLVFFMSLLAVARVRGGLLLAVGGMFCLASYLTYFALGLGLLKALQALEGFRRIQDGFSWAMTAVLLLLAVLSFRDAGRFLRRRDPREVTLQMPAALRRLSHRLLQRGLATRSLPVAAFGLGAAVTALESVCTGQLYVPTLAFMVKSGPLTGRGLPLLALYNLGFILPLAAVFVVTWAGLRFAALMNWSLRNVVLSKILLGLLFLALAVGLWVLSLAS